MAVTRPSNTNAVRLRRTKTDAERRMWFALRDRRFAGTKFRRQVPIGPYIADFLCAQARLVLEIDGGQHGEMDQARDEWLAAQGFVGR